MDRLLFTDEQIAELPEKLKGETDAQLVRMILADAKHTSIFAAVPKLQMIRDGSYMFPSADAPKQYWRESLAELGHWRGPLACAVKAEVKRRYGFK